MSRTTSKRMRKYTETKNMNVGKGSFSLQSESDVSKDTLDSESCADVPDNELKSDLETVSRSQDNRLKHILLSTAVFGGVCAVAYMFYIVNLNENEGDKIIYSVSGVTAVGTWIVNKYKVKGYCRLKECCTDRWTNSPNITGLHAALRNRVFGQHLVTDTVFKVVKGHVLNKAPSKALALSFNGWTGSGKNFVSKIIAKHLFGKGMESNFVHQVIATHDFPHQSEIDSYKDRLRKWIVQSVSKCERSLFIFDEMDKMPEGLVDVLKPFLDYHPEIGGVDYRKSIFLFLSNTGGNLINEEVVKNWKHGKPRESITIKQMDRIINLGAFNSKGGFWHTSLIQDNLIDFFVPFMPLEKSHIKQCAKVDIEKKGRHKPTEEAINKVADEFLYFPDEKVFSTSGCKKISSKVDFVLG